MAVGLAIPICLKNGSISTFPFLLAKGIKSGTEDLMEQMYVQSNLLLFCQLLILFRLLQMCAMAKRLNLVLQQIPTDPDLIILEFAVNDYQGQDQLFRLDWVSDSIKKVSCIHCGLVYSQLF